MNERVILLLFHHHILVFSALSVCLMRMMIVVVVAVVDDLIAPFFAARCLSLPSALTAAYPIVFVCVCVYSVGVVVVIVAVQIFTKKTFKHTGHFGCYASFVSSHIASILSVSISSLCLKAQKKEKPIRCW